MIAGWSLVSAGVRLNALTMRGGTLSEAKRHGATLSPTWVVKATWFPYSPAKAPCKNSVLSG